jgi:hypothetical protein
MIRICARWRLFGSSTVVAGAIRYFKALPVERQRCVEMFVDAERISEAEGTILGFAELTVIAARRDLPAN